jgi:signal transduction histidine kinase
VILAPHLRDLVDKFESFSCAPGDTADLRTKKAHFALAMSLIIPAGVLWGLIYFAFGARLAAVLPLSYAALSAVNLALLRRTGAFTPFRYVELTLIIALPFLLQLALGGFVAGSAVVVWGFLGPWFAVAFGTPREAIFWFVVFLATVVAAGALQSTFAVDNSLPLVLVRWFFVMNVGAVSSIAFGMLVSFGRKREQLRELQEAYLAQNLMLREREKLATLGTLAAGVAHELNNPAAAVQRSAEQLGPTLDEIRRGSLVLAGREHVAALLDAARPAMPVPGGLSPLETADREQRIEDWLEGRAVARAWEHAPALVAGGYTPEVLEELAGGLDDPGDVAATIAFLAHTDAARALSDGIAGAAHRISDIVGALRSYSYLDRGTWQTIDVTEGLESTMVLLQAKLRTMTVEREYAADLPRIEVRGNELNQVWTNIIDNAIDATGGTGRLVVRTAAGVSDAHDVVVVELEDDGAGIATGVVEKVFDPFFTTKPPGSGTGLGLNISHNIVVRQHGGQISVRSRPGHTCFRVALPVRRLPGAGDGADGDTDLGPATTPA